MTPPRPARRILLLRTSSLGDVVHCLPVLSALRRHLPDARLAWVVEAPIAALLEGHPDLDEVVPVRLRAWRRRPFAPAVLREVLALRRALRGFGADAALDLMANHKAGALAWWSGAPRRVGLARPFRREPSSALWINETVRARGEHAVDRALSLLDALGLPPRPADFGGERLFGGGQGAPGRLPDATAGSFVVIHPGASWPNKRYPAPLWGHVARRLRLAAGVPALVTAGPGEEALAEEVRAASDGAARPVSAPSLADLAAFLRGARLVLAGDTGPLHLAHALGTPVLCLMGPTVPERSGPYGAPERCLWRPPPGGASRSPRRAPATLHEIAPQEVATAALRLLRED